jgi:hypothetical protein
MLNCIIRLQAVVEIITNEIARALNLLAKQSTKIQNAIYQKLLSSRIFACFCGRSLWKIYPKQRAAYKLMMKGRS